LTNSTTNGGGFVSNLDDDALGMPTKLEKRTERVLSLLEIDMTIPIHAQEHSLHCVIIIFLFVQSVAMGSIIKLIADHVDDDLPPEMPPLHRLVGQREVLELERTVDDGLDLNGSYLTLFTV
jgi:hypothetical protein